MSATVVVVDRVVLSSLTCVVVTVKPAFSFGEDMVRNGSRAVATAGDNGSIARERMPKGK